MLTQPFTLMISGLIGSRIPNEIALAEIRSSLLHFKREFQGCEIVISTYEGEVPQEILDLVDKIVYSQDPGPDTVLRRHFLGKNVSPSVYNYSRLLATTVSGLNACSHRIVFKTRIELIPSEATVFASAMIEPVEKIANSELPLIGFLTQHYSGVSFCVNGTLGILPDTFQVAKKETLLKTWTLAQSIWLENLKDYKFGIRRYPITCEQILGLSFLSQYCDLDINMLYRKLNRYIFSKKLLKKQDKFNTYYSTAINKFINIYLDSYANVSQYTKLFHEI
jgi:hypothetical protein